MARSRRLIAAGVVLVLALAAGSPASAASPQQIYRDLGDNGILDGKYTDADLERAFNLREVLRSDARRPMLSKRNLDPPEPLGVATPAPPRADGRRVPFSGLDLALLIAGGGPLLLIGAGLRRRLASAPADAPVPSA